MLMQAKNGDKKEGIMKIIPFLFGSLKTYSYL